MKCNISHSFFWSLYYLSSHLNEVILEPDYEVSCALPSQKEVMNADFSIRKTCSPGPNGFGAGFYMACWFVVENDVFDAVCYFFLRCSFILFLQ